MEVNSNSGEKFDKFKQIWKMSAPYKKAIF